MMKSCLFFVATACLVLSVLGQDDPWVQVWADEFNGDKLDRFNWQIEVNCWGGGNAELQCYTAKPDNIKVENGKLVLTAIYEPAGYVGSTDDCTDNTQNSCFWTKNFRSGRVRSKANNINSWKYGRIEMSAQLPNGKHLWPAFWMMPSDDVYGTWAASGEIDIMEYRGQAPTMNEGTLHFGAPWPNNKHEGSGPLDMGVGDMSAGYHTYAVEWERDEIRWYVDNNNFHKMNLNQNFSNGPFAYAQNRSPFDQRFHILLNLAIGGGFFNDPKYGTFTPEESRQWANPTYKIDYVRVSQRKSTLPKPDCGSAIQISGGMTEMKSSSAMTVSVGIIVMIIAILFQ